MSDILNTDSVGPNGKGIRRRLNFNFLYLVCMQNGKRDPPIQQSRGFDSSLSKSGICGRTSHERAFPTTHPNSVDRS